MIANAIACQAKAHVGSKIIQNQTKPDTSHQSLCSRQEERENQVFSPAKHCRYKTATQKL